MKETCMRNSAKKTVSWQEGKDEQLFNKNIGFCKKEERGIGTEICPVFFEEKDKRRWRILR